MPDQNNGKLVVLKKVKNLPMTSTATEAILNRGKRGRLKIIKFLTTGSYTDQYKHCWAASTTMLL